MQGRSTDDRAQGVDPYAVSEMAPPQVSRRAALWTTLSFVALIASVPLIQIAYELGQGDKVHVLDIFERPPTAENLERYQQELVQRSVVAERARAEIGKLRGWYSDVISEEDPILAELKIQAEGVHLGPFLRSDREKLLASTAYRDPAAALAAMDQICWAVPNVVAPFVGTAPRPGRHGTATINRRLLRSPRELDEPKPSGTVRIFFTGGSTAFGAGAPSDETTIGGFLEKLLNEGGSPGRRFEVLTAANPAWASTQARILIENVLIDLEPDLVITFGGVNEAHWGKYGQNVLWFRSPADHFYFQLVNLVFARAGHQHSTDVLQISPSAVPASSVADRLLYNLELSSFVLSRRQVPFVFALQPMIAATAKPLTAREEQLRRDRDPSEREYFESCYREIRRRLTTCEELTFLDLSKAFDELSSSDEVFLDAYHFGDRGNEILAKALLPHVRALLGEQ